MSLFYANEFLNCWLPQDELLRPNVDCERCSLADERPSSAERWRQWKCCTFEPFVANFLLGRFPAESISLNERVSWQPIGRVPRQSYRERYLAEPEDERGADFACSFYDARARGCRVWRLRPAECSTYFCKTAGYPRDELSVKLSRIESAVAQMALAEFGFTAAEIAEQMDFFNDPSLPEPAYEFEYVRDLYRRANEWAQKLDPAKVLAWR